MLWNASALRHFTIEATDGQIGTVADLLFDDHSWTTRWLVVETGSWFAHRRVLLPLSALGKPDEAARHFTVHLTRQQVKDSPDVDTDLPVSRHKEAHVYNYYDWNPYWTSGFAAMSNAIATPLVLPFARDDVEPRYQDQRTDAVQDDGDPELRSVQAVIGYHIAATDGDIGHAEDFIADADGWHIRFLTIDTKNWLPGQRVVISPRLIRHLDWLSHAIYLTVTAAKIKSSPPYDPAMTEDGAFNDAFEDYFGLKIPDGKTTIAPKISA